MLFRELYTHDFEPLDYGLYIVVDMQYVRLCSVFIVSFPFLCHLTPSCHIKPTVTGANSLTNGQCFLTWPASNVEWSHGARGALFEVVTVVFTLFCDGFAQQPFVHLISLCQCRYWPQRVFINYLLLWLCSFYFTQLHCNVFTKSCVCSCWQGRVGSESAKLLMWQLHTPALKEACVLVWRSTVQCTSLKSPCWKDLTQRTLYLKCDLFQLSHTMPNLMLWQDIYHVCTVAVDLCRVSQLQRRAWVSGMSLSGVSVPSVPPHRQPSPVAQHSAHWTR